MAGMYSYKKFFQNLYADMGQQYKFQAQTPEEITQWKQEFKQALKETLGLDILEEISARWIKPEKQPESGNGMGTMDSFPWPVE